MKYKTTAAYISGAICGQTWMPQAMASIDYQRDLRGFNGIMDRFTEPATFRDALLSCLRSDGGDFQNPEFTADSIIRIERRKAEKSGYSVHVKEITIADIEPDLVNSEYETFDFWNDND